MQGIGERMRDRARELGWSDTEVARRLGITQQRYASYVADRHEPDLATLMRICLVLGLPPNALLQGLDQENDVSASLREKALSLLHMLDGADLAVVVSVLDAIVIRSRVMPGGTKTAALETRQRKRQPGMIKAP